MDFAFSEEQDMLRAAARTWLADHYPLDRVAQLADGDAGWDPLSFKQLRDMGWLDPELGTLDHAVLAEETGYALFPGPWFTTVALAAPAYPDPPPYPVTLAYADDGAATLRTAVTSVACRADDDLDGWRLSGVKRVVPDAAVATEAVVVARTGDSVGLFRLDLTEHPEVIHPLATLDSTRRLAELRLDGTPAESLGDPRRTRQTLGAIRHRARALLACEAVGVGQRALDIAVAYAGTRIQFDRPIGSYQGVAYRLADSYSMVELARSLAYRAAWSVATDDGQADEATLTAAVAASQAAVTSCENAIQAMGGVGFTWSHPLHRLYKRAQWIASFDGTPSRHRAELATLLLDG